MPRSVELAIIGGGPAGLTAGLYASRARLKAVLLERLGPGGQVLLTDWVDNYPGFPEGVSGFDLMEHFRAQAVRFGLAIENADVQRLHLGPPHVLELGAESLEAKAVIIASGARPNLLGVPGEAELTGKGVSYCGTCDAPFYRGQVVAAVGGGDTAVSEALYLTRFVDKVYLIHRRGTLRAAKVLQERLFASDKVEMVWDSVVEAIEGAAAVEAVAVRNVKTGERRHLQVSGVFVWIGVCPNTGFLSAGELDTDRWGFIVADSEMCTARPGIFAAGDVRSKHLRQIANAVGEGAVAAFSAQHYLEGL